jgi:hypothetical protein
MQKKISTMSFRNRKARKNDEGREKPFSNRTKEKELKRDQEIVQTISRYIAKYDLQVKNRGDRF